MKVQSDWREGLRYWVQPRATSTKHSMKSEVFCSEKVAVDLRETQERLRDEWEDRRSCLKRADSFEVRLEERHARTLANVER